MARDTVFRQKAPGIMRDLIADFAIGMEDAAAILGNAGAECAGFTKLQEIKPTVPGSRGGWGWFQWTGPRRRAFEAYCEAKGLDPSSDQANYGFLCKELRTIEKRAIPAVMMANGLDQKVIAFEQNFERAGIAHYDSRQQWARIALEEFERRNPQPSEPETPDVREPDAQPDPVPVPRDRPDDAPAPDPEVPAAPADKPSLWQRFKGWIYGGGASGAGALAWFDWRIIVALIVGVIVLVILGYIAALILWGRERVGARIASWLP